MLLVTGACALERDYVDVRYGPARYATPVPGAGAVAVAVAARDARTARQDRVSSKINGYGMEMAPIVANNDVVAETADALRAELARAGFRIDDAGARLEVDVLRFYNEFRTGWTPPETLLSVGVMVDRWVRTQRRDDRAGAARGCLPGCAGYGCGSPRAYAVAGLLL
ncbi:YajG family lipoprotein, partial [Roseomonas sp. HF4]|uniref:YajG family lipoprotein n=1 Tax=Roseomonas sp. HF4 TaxID=2562313 RepID=UPI0014852012